MKYVFELHDNIIKKRLSIHKTFKGAMNAMVKAVAETAPAVCRDVEGEDDQGPDMTLSYSVKPCVIKE